MSGIFGPVLAGYMCGTRLGRKYTMVIGALITMIFFFCFTQVRSASQIVGFNCAISFALNIYYGCLYAYTPEVLPSAHRGTGNGIAIGFNRIMGILSAVIATEADVSDKQNPFFRKENIANRIPPYRQAPLCRSISAPPFTSSWPSLRPHSRSSRTASVALRYIFYRNGGEAPCLLRPARPKKKRIDVIPHLTPPSFKTLYFLYTLIGWTAEKNNLEDLREEEEWVHTRNSDFSTIT